MPQKKYWNQEPTRSPRTSPSVWMNEMSLARSGLPNTVAKASSEVNRIVKNVISTKVESCSMLANFHHARQRERFSDVGSKM